MKRKASAKRLHVVVTAGPTREYIDPVRYLSNESSGRMGFRIAEAAAARGHRVTLVAGPVHLETPPGQSGARRSLMARCLRKRRFSKTFRVFAPTP